MAMLFGNPALGQLYDGFRYRVRWGSAHLAGITMISGLGGGRREPGRIKYDAITLQRSLTHDAEFQKWVSRVGPYQRKDILIDEFDGTGKLKVSYKLFNCWVSAYHGLPTLGSGGSSVAIEHLKLENEAGKTAAQGRVTRSGESAPGC